MSNYNLNLSKYHFILRNSSIDQNLNPNETFNLNIKLEEEIHFQLLNVFRVKSGTKVSFQNKIFSDSPQQSILKIEITEANKKTLSGKVLELNQIQIIKPKYKLSLAFGLPNNKNKLDLIIQKATELEADEIILLKTDLADFKHDLNTERLEKITFEAAEQSERLTCPIIKTYKSIKELHLNSTNSEIKIALERTENSILNLTKLSKDTIILIGPEGGFSESEKAYFKESNLSNLSLGNSILRMETAAIVALGYLNLIRNN